MRLLAAVVFALAPILCSAGDGDPALQFFETKVRPVLADRCYSCHSGAAKKLKADLYVDSLAGLLKGGESGTALVPGHPEQSRLIEAVGYKNVDLQMPPKEKLSDQQIADLTTWVRQGAVWPAEKSPVAAAPTAAVAAFDLQHRKQNHWAWQPVRIAAPPALKDRAWAHDAVDQFVLAGLEAQGMHPAAPADPRTLIRRVTFDLTGLPPTPEEVKAFLADTSRDPLAKVVDRLLASPRFGERWARHWLDLARYAETLGHEFDFVLPNAWRYRDYVIRAFNADVPYDQFVVEQLAGDLLPSPRTNPADGTNESIIGTGFQFFGESVHSPVDVRQNQADLIDNKIDVTGKAILGLTVACARCHDHKFDAISAADYYAMYGLFESTRYAQRAVNGSAIRAKTAELEAVRGRIREAVAAAYARRVGEVTKHAAEGHGTAGREGRTAAVARDGDVELADFSAGFGEWAADGVAFGSRPTRPGDFVLGDSPARPIAAVLTGSSASTGTVSRKLEGTLRSPTFTIDRRYLFVHGAGHESRINVCVEGLNIIRAPIYGGLKRVLKSNDKATWLTFDLDMWKGRRAYIEFADSTVPDEADHDSYAAGGWITVDRVTASDEPKPPTFSDAPGRVVPPATSSAGTTADHDPRWVTETIEAFGRGTLADLPDAPARATFLNGMAQRGLADASAGASASLAVLLAEAHRIEESIPAPVYVPAAADGSGVDEHVFIRGSHKNLGPPVPRRLLEALDGHAPPAADKGSGRLELARQLVDPANPLVSRVIVNRVWHHLFGRGIVASTDNFGVLGEKPSDPALLDYLAARFVKEGWSIKRLVRELALSSTYQMASRNERRFDEIDPDNRLMHRANLRRLEGEAIRDEILSASGRLNLTAGGPGVDVHLTAFMDGRGRPPSGPLDGDGRRSVYLGVRRNFLSPLLLAFDTPIPFSAMGRRSVSNVPAQALILLNDPFVVEQAKLWATRVTGETASPAQRIERMYQTAFCRPPTAAETIAALAFVDRQTAAWKAEGSDAVNDPRAWADLAHVLMNLKEFIFIN